jgi:hypothetical protein
MSTTSSQTRSSAERTRRHRKRKRQGTRCITVDVSESEIAAMVARGYLQGEERDDAAQIKKAIEEVLSDVEFEVQSERAYAGIRA